MLNAPLLSAAADVGREPATEPLVGVAVFRVSASGTAGSAGCGVPLCARTPLLVGRDAPLTGRFNALTACGEVNPLAGRVGEAEPLLDSFAEVFLLLLFFSFAVDNPSEVTAWSKESDFAMSITMPSPFPTSSDNDSSSFPSLLVSLISLTAPSLLVGRAIPSEELRCSAWSDETDLETESLLLEEAGPAISLIGAAVCGRNLTERSSAGVTRVVIGAMGRARLGLWMRWDTKGESAKCSGVHVNNGSEIIGMNRLHKFDNFVTLVSA